MQTTTISTVTPRTRPVVDALALSPADRALLAAATLAGARRPESTILPARDHLDFSGPRAQRHCGPWLDDLPDAIADGVDAIWRARKTGQESEAQRELARLLTTTHLSALCDAAEALGVRVVMDTLPAAPRCACGARGSWAWQHVVRGTSATRTSVWAGCTRCRGQALGTPVPAADYDQICGATS